MRIPFMLLFLFSFIFCSSQVDRRKSIATRTEMAPRIDGSLDEPCWSLAEPTGRFSQYLPIHNANPSFSTSVRVLYDDQAIYIGAFMTDEYPDSIPLQLGNRDDEDMNVDYFAVEFDTYNNGMDGYTFAVTAAGVQMDSRETDETYDGVWMSEVRILQDGWSAEIKIPYSAIRFPNLQKQTWGLQFIRSIRRYREFDQWSLEKQGADNTIVYWGELHNIENIVPPLRLSVTPFLAAAVEHYPDTIESDVNATFAGGMDLKYGINESFTLDMTLLPDFSQVQSDSKIKNLTAFETVYSEQRPFFKEAVDLFEKGDLFYSRRIGQTPQGYYNIPAMDTTGARIINNPVQQRLLNATKISGRTRGGLAIGILNAVTANTFATVEFMDGTRKDILTDPASNYNVLVLAQALKNNSEIYLTNTSLLRSKGYDDANVTAGGLKLKDRTNNYFIDINGGISQNFSQSAGGSELLNELGFKTFVGIGKNNGNFQFTLVKGAMNGTYNANAMGVTLYNNYHYNAASVAYNLYQPWWILRDMNNYLQIHNENNFETGKVQTAELTLKSFGTTMKYLSIWLGADWSFMETYDYYEPRVPGRFYISPESWQGNLGISSDYRKPFALDVLIDFGKSGKYNTHRIGCSIHPIIRVNDHLMMNYNFSWNQTNSQVGFAWKNESADSILFGKRDVVTIVNTMSGKYLFRNNLSLNLNARHYLSTGKYHQYFNLKEDGLLVENSDFDDLSDFSFNVFTVDLIFSWIFAPGSSLNLSWKNSVTPPDETRPEMDFFTNLRNTFDYAQRNTISVKIMYYLDYLQFKRYSSRHQPKP